MPKWLTACRVDEVSRIAYTVGETGEIVRVRVDYGIHQARALLPLKVWADAVAFVLAGKPVVDGSFVDYKRINAVIAAAVATGEVLGAPPAPPIGIFRVNSNNTPWLYDPPDNDSGLLKLGRGESLRTCCWSMYRPLLPGRVHVCKQVGYSLFRHSAVYSGYDADDPEIGCWICDEIGCERSICAGCGATHPFTCDRCGESYCECEVNGRHQVCIVHLDRRVYHPDEFCSNCRRCDSCCHCFTGIVQAVHVTEVRFHPASRRRQVTNPLKRYIAAEIEVAGAQLAPGQTINGVGPLDAVVSRWGCGVVRDNSLPRGRFGGFEINTSPAMGYTFVRQVSQLCEALSKHRAKVTDQCGLHVHADARDLTSRDLRKFANLYYACEAGLFSMVPPERRASRFARPCAVSYVKGLELKEDLGPQETAAYIRSKMEDKLYGTHGADARSMSRRKYLDIRYHAVNLHSYFLRQTIELRLPSGTVEAKEIVCWAILFGAIVSRSRDCTDHELLSLTKDYVSAAGPAGENFSTVKHWRLPVLQERSIAVLSDLSPTESVRKFVKQRFAEYGGQLDR